MATNLAYKDAWRLDLPVPVGTVRGDPVLVGKLPGVALIDRQSDGQATVDTHGAYRLPVKAIDSEGNSAIAIGEDLYFDSGSIPKISKSAAGTYYGKALAEVAEGEEASIPVRLGDGPSAAAATIVVDDVTIENDGVVGLQVIDAGITATKLGGVANDRPVIIPIGAVSATTTVVAFVAPSAGALKSAKLVNKNAVSVSDTDYWTIELIDKGGAGAGTDSIVAKTTQETGGSALEAYVALDLGTLDATHKVLAAGDVVALVITKSGSAAALAEASLALVWNPQEA